MKKTVVILICLFVIAGCCKDKGEDCVKGSEELTAFAEIFGGFYCNGNTEYQYILRKKDEFTSLQPNCFFPGGMFFPINEDSVVYIAIGKMSTHRKDTFETTIVKDICNKKLVYNVSMIQNDTTLSNFPGPLHMFCIVENIPADYQVEIKYKYVPLP
ncbi:MAG TPA: hypothetical protein PLW44_03905 [Chitinophagales bacterium]|nr:hypothetical protein [Chitinophagales bacterium]